MTDLTPYEALRSTKLAAELTDDQCRVLAGLVTLRDLNQGETLVAEGVVDNHLYVILQGDLAVIKNAGTDAAETLFTLGGGDFVGELSFIDNKPHSATLTTASEESVVLKIDRNDFDKFVVRYPNAGFKVLMNVVQDISQLVRRMNSQYVDMAGYVFGRTKR